MTTLQITLEESVAEAIRVKAQREGKTPETVVAEIVSAQTVHVPPDKAWIKGFLENAREVRGDSGGKKWTRDELYDR